MSRHYHHHHYYGTEGYCGVTFLDHPFYHTPMGHRVVQWCCALFAIPFILVLAFVALINGSDMVLLFSLLLAVIAVGKFQHHKRMADNGFQELRVGPNRPE